MLFKQSKKIIATACMTFCLLGINLVTQAHAEYPEKPISVLVMSTPGGGTDLFMRQIAPLLTKELGQTVNVINKPGGNGNVAANVLLQARKDGYTLAFLGEDILGLNYINFNVNYKYEDIIPISLLGGAPFGFYAHGESKWNDFHDVVKTAKEENRPIKVAVFDTKTRYVLADLAKNAGVEFTFIPSQSAATTLTAVLGKHAELGVIGAGVSDSIVAGKAKLIGSLAKERFPKVPNVPTVLEQGFKFHAHTSNVFLYAAKGTPEDIIAKLEKVIAKIAPTAEYKKVIEAVSFIDPVVTGRKDSQVLTKAAYDFAMKAKAEKE